MQKEPLTGRLPYTLTNDYLFHIVFQRNNKILRELIKSLLNLKDEEIIDIRLENPITPGERMEDKSVTLFPKYPEFYAHYAMKNIINNNIYSDKLLINVLDLTQIDIATEADIACGLQHWAKLFKATTWEDIRMLTANYKDLENIVDIVQDALADKEIRMQCEARERYERDRISLFDSGKREGISEGISQGHASGFEEGIINAIHMAKDMNVTKEITITQLVKQFGLSEENATERVKQYWE